MYNMIFKRKSFHLFRDNKTRIYFNENNHLTDEELENIYKVFKTFIPLIKDIKVEIKIVQNNLTTCKRGQEYCILFYSEKKDNYLQNIGYLGEQLDLYLVSKNIGTLWFGVGKTELLKYHELDFVTMIAIGKAPENMFRKDMFKSKRKKLEETWVGDTLGVGEIVRFTPSACNTQPWICENTGDELVIYRYKKPGKRGIMPAEKVRFYNKIDMGIYLFMLEVCLENEGYKFDRFIYEDNTCDEIEKTLIAKYVISK